MGEAASSEPTAPRLWRAMAIAALFPIALAAIALWFGSEYRRAETSNAQVNRSYEDRIKIGSLLSTMKDAETGQRGYVITGDPSFLEPYTKAKERIGAQLRAVEDSTRDETPEIRAAVVDLRRSIDAKLVELQTILTVRKNNPVSKSALDPAARLVAAGKGKRLMDRIRTLQQKIVAHKANKLAFSLRYQQDRNQRTQQLLWIIVALAAILSMAAAYVIWLARRDRFLATLAAADSATRQRAVLDATLDAIILINPSGSIERLNPAAETLFGHAATDLLRRDISLIADLAPGDGSFLDRLGYGPDGLAQPFRGRLLARRADGRTVPVEAALGVMKLPDGVHIVAAFRDITERERAEKLKNQFLSTVSHELRTPLTSIVGSLGLLRGGAVEELPPSVNRLVVIAESNATRLIRLVNDLLDIEKLESGAMTFDFTPLALAEVAGRSIDATRAIATARAITLKIEGADNPTIVRADADRLVQVIVNLLSNAIRFSPDGGTVTLTIAQKMDRANITVRDQGPGIGPELGKQLFARFVQGAQPGGANLGTGLGLAISREIVRAHGGEIWHENAPAGGAMFRFDIPLWNLASAQEEMSSAPRLLICANKSESVAIRDAFDGRNIRADVVADVQSAYEAAKTRRYLALVLDCHHVGSGGMADLRAIRSDPDTCGLPVIAIAGADDVPGPSQWASLDIVDWISKPIDTQQLGQAIDSVVSRSAGKLPLILHVDDDSDTLEITAAALAGRARIACAVDVASARAFLAENRPDVVVIDLALPDGSGHDLVSDLSAPEALAIPVIIYSAQDGGTAFARDVEAVLTKSRRSLPSLVETVSAILERQSNREDA